MGTKKHEIVSKLTEFCSDKGYIVVEVANREVGENAMGLLKSALQFDRPVSFKLKEINGAKAFSIKLNVKDLENGVFTALDHSNEVNGKIRRFPFDGYELCGKHIFFPEASDADEFTRLKDILRNK